MTTPVNQRRVVPSLTVEQAVAALRYDPETRAMLLRLLRLADEVLTVRTDG